MSMDAMRREYSGPILQDGAIGADPIAFFRQWFAEAEACDRHMANAMTLATVDASGMPDARIVLLKEVDADGGFAFFTNTASAKGQQLAAAARAALVFHWAALDRQIRIRGVVEPLPRERVEAYFHSRPRASQVAAAAAVQGEVLKGRAALDSAYEELAQQLGEKEVPVPAVWGGYRVMPQTCEFWQGQASRLHDRLVCERQADGSWQVQRLAP